MSKNQTAEENDKDLSVMFRKQFVIPVAISGNTEFKEFIEGISKFSGNQMGDGKDTIFVGTFEKRRGLDTLVYKLAISLGFDKYKIVFIRDKDVSQPVINAYNRISFEIVTRKKEGLPEKNITIIEKFLADNFICTDYYETAIFNNTSNWVAKDVMHYDESTKLFSHSVIKKDNERHGHKFEIIVSKNLLIDLDNIEGIEIRGETIFGKTGKELSINDMLHIFRTVKEFNVNNKQAEKEIIAER